MKTAPLTTMERGEELYYAVIELTELLGKWTISLGNSCLLIRGWFFLNFSVKENHDPTRLL